MDSDSHIAWAVAVVLVALIAGGVFGGLKCQQSNNDLIRACIQSGKSPLECQKAAQP